VHGDEIPEPRVNPREPSVVGAGDIPTRHEGPRVNSAADREADIRARLQEHWDASERGDVDAEHAIYAADAILDYPQSGERFIGRSRIQAQRGGHPAERHFTILGGGDVWVGECVITYDGVRRIDERCPFARSELETARTGAAVSARADAVSEEERACRAARIKAVISLERRVASEAR
jgi:hypothetical protein